MRVDETSGTTSFNWTPVYEECVLIPLSRLHLAIHKIEQTLEGQYPEGQALEAALMVLREFAPPPTQDDE